MVLNLNDIIGMLTLLVTCIPGAWFLIRLKQQRQRNVGDVRSSFCDLVRNITFLPPLSRAVKSRSFLELLPKLIVPSSLNQTAQLITSETCLISKRNEIVLMWQFRREYTSLPIMSVSTPPSPHLSFHASM